MKSDYSMHACYYGCCILITLLWRIQIYLSHKKFRNYFDHTTHTDTALLCDRNLRESFFIGRLVPLFTLFRCCLLHPFNWVHVVNGTENDRKIELPSGKSINLGDLYTYNGRKKKSRINHWIKVRKFCCWRCFFGKYFCCCLFSVGYILVIFFHCDW